MAFAIMGGLSVASLLTLLVIPTLYVTWESLRGTDLRQATVPGA
jgi:Cu/Ag efflux pump CusA